MCLVTKYLLYTIQTHNAKKYKVYIYLSVLSSFFYTAEHVCPTYELLNKLDKLKLKYKESKT